MSANAVPSHVGCPAWCTTEHGVFAGEDDHLHTGAPLYLTDRVAAVLCATIDPDTGAIDGPYLLVDTEEWTLGHTRSVGQALIALADTGSPAATQAHTWPSNNGALRSR